MEKWKKKDVEDEIRRRRRQKEKSPGGGEECLKTIEEKETCS